MRNWITQAFLGLACSAPDTTPSDATGEGCGCTLEQPVQVTGRGGAAQIVALDRLRREP